MGGSNFARCAMNEPHPERVMPSVYGDSVGHYEGDTLVIDTVGIKTDRPFAMVDMYGTPYTNALHVLERYRLLDYEAAKEGLERAAKENFRLPPDSIPPVADRDPNYRGKHLQLTFTVEDEGVFTTPWSATMTYGRPPMPDGRGRVGAEYVCAENLRYSGRKPAVPTRQAGLLKVSMARVAAGLEIACRAGPGGGPKGKDHRLGPCYSVSIEFPGKGGADEHLPSTAR